MSLPDAVKVAGSPHRTFGSRIATGAYERYQVRLDGPQRLVAQVLVLPSASLQMKVRESEAALAVDFRNSVTRPDLSGATQRCRPGYFLPDILQALRQARRTAVLFNGNNVGWWGNQFVIRGGRLVYKRKGPLFDDGCLPYHATGEHSFFVSGPDGFDIVDLTLRGTRHLDNASEFDLRATGRLPRCGLSGFPLLRSGRNIWRERIEHAWDPGLLFNLGPLRADGYGAIRQVVRGLLDGGEQLVRHSMTVVGLDDVRNVVLLVVERSARSRGMTVAEAARLLKNRFGVRDALVLGAAGDAQLATTAEGFLTAPLVANYAKAAARRIPDELLSPELSAEEPHARPVPCYVALHHAGECKPPTAHRPLPPLAAWAAPIGMA